MRFGQHTGIPETQDAIPHGLQRPRPLGIPSLVNLFAVLPAIQLHNKSLGKAGEVDDVTAYGHLPAKTVAINLPAPKAEPEFAFGVSHVSP
jgi:hypothetical protein